MTECPTCRSPEPRLHPAVAPDGEVTHICKDKFHDMKPTLRISSSLGLYVHIPVKPKLERGE